VITVSDTRTAATDKSGDILEDALKRGGHSVPLRAWARDTRTEVRRAVRGALARRDLDVIVLTGGTGVAPRDVTPEAIAPFVSRWLPGFGELFRMISYAEVGAAAWLSRAAAGVARGKLLVILPGSPTAVRLAADRLLVPELAHVVRLLKES
jgi:molybdenum cofactor biosynthesis protein B